MNDIRLYQIALTLIPGIGPVSAKQLISYCGGPEAVFKETHKNLLKIPGIGPVASKAIRTSKVMKDAEDELKFIEKKGIELLFFLDNKYPGRLRHVEDSPVVLYYKGSETLNHGRTVAIVGTRSPTDYGINNCEKLVGQLQAYGVQVISGLAYGIDTCAHSSSLKEGIKTIGVIGHGLDRLYPAENKRMVQKMIEQGGILSQFTSGTMPDRENFPMRNKIIAAMADVVVVIESKTSGGSIITAEMANDYHKDVFAIPGRLNDEVSQGCNRLIKIHKANLLQSAKDIAYIMRWDELDALKTIQTSLFVELDEKERMLIDTIRSNNGIDIDTLSYKTSMSGSQLASILLTLEFKGLVKARPGKKYIIR